MPKRKDNPPNQVRVKQLVAASLLLVLFSAVGTAGLVSIGINAVVVDVFVYALLVFGAIIAWDRNVMGYIIIFFISIVLAMTDFFLIFTRLGALRSLGVAWGTFGILATVAAVITLILSIIVLFEHKWQKD
jgi:hypothetical protein